jgi:hypothetical protein
MEVKRRRELLLLALVVLLGGGAYVAVEGWPFGAADTSAGQPAASNLPGQPGPQGRMARNERPAGGAAEAPDVHLEALDAARPKPESAGRDLFRFKPKAPPPRPVATQPTRPVDVAPTPAGPPPPPPITLKFIGIIDAGQPKKVVAVLSDGRGTPVYGSEGETVLGQYRILRIGTESIELSYLDGRGRQTIRFTGL